MLGRKAVLLSGLSTPDCPIRVEAAWFFLREEGMRRSLFSNFPTNVAITVLVCRMVQKGVSTRGGEYSGLKVEIPKSEV